MAADQGTTIKVTVSFTDDASNAETLTSAATAAVAAAPNTPATGAPTITGTAQVGQTLTAGTTAIMDADGLTSVSYTYQWIRVATDNTETNISSATASTYTLVAADQGKTVKVTVSFTDDASNAETLTSAATAAVSAAPNTPATGAPTITGTAQVGQTLTAGTTAIMDANGLTSVSYTYQWIRVDGGTETNISGATASTYTLVAADQGTTIKVTVRFTDDASNAETLTSVATAAVSAAGNTRPPRVSITNDLSVREDIGMAVVPVTLSWPTQVSLSVPWSTSELDAVSPDDFTDGQGALTFAPGASRATVSIPIADDGVQEDDESFSVTLGTGEGYSLEQVSVVVNILDNDSGELLPSQATVSGTTLVLTYDKALDSASAPGRSHFYVTADGMRVDVDEVSVGGSMVTLTLATAVQAGQTVTLGCAGCHLIKDVNDNAAASFSGWLVTNNTEGAADPPGRPAAPSVSATAGSTTSLDVTWAAPSNTGPAITSYDLQYRQGTSGNFTTGPQNVTATSASPSGA